MSVVRTGPQMVGELDGRSVVAKVVRKAVGWVVMKVVQKVAPTVDRLGH